MIGFVEADTGVEFIGDVDDGHDELVLLLNDAFGGRSNGLVDVVNGCVVKLWLDLLISRASWREFHSAHNDVRGAFCSVHVRKWNFVVLLQLLIAFMITQNEESEWLARIWRSGMDLVALLSEKLARGLARLVFVLFLNEMTLFISAKAS